MRVAGHDAIRLTREIQTRDEKSIASVAVRRKAVTVPTRLT